ncbi:Aste57867_10939 [Aphanomyces stellatus]|uniref:Aste57867_10939 protein n=1 Tax=Aphanomyces stellatus TaxID=120398 RepID=A0A485KS32_9STRA|nr:hypothetical protein As57867_010899 [Aphanomyces stellatus]VFT87807.1 Aste57867_10939 [Aphanomyces stellatus]
MVRAVALAFVLATPSMALSYPPFTIPAFNLNTLDTASTQHLVKSLETHGIVAFQGIPNVSSVRRMLLSSAAACAASHPELSQLKTLQDGTMRQTFTTDKAGLGVDVVDQCPEYAQAHAMYTKVMDSTLAQFGRVLDGATTISNHTIDSLEVIAASGNHLVHTHLYSNATTPPTNPTADEWSFQIHTDRGVGLLSTAPLFFDVMDGHEVPNPDVDVGLLLELDGHLVRPDLKDDELFFMAGQGFGDWLDTSVHAPAVLHGMIMPRNAPTNVVRAWVGEMVLPPANHRLRSYSNMPFADLNAATTRFLVDGGDSVPTLGCPIGRVLTASDNSCQLGLWVPGKGSSATKDACVKTCNNQHLADKCNAMKCEQKGTASGVDCWMVCVPHLGANACPAPGKEVCSGQDMICQK